MKIYREIFKDKTWLTYSNILTFLRILLTPFIVIGIFYEQWNLAFCLFLIAGATDLIDGYLARLFKQETFMGKALDPVADKFLIISSFSALAYFQSPSFIIPKWFVFFILIRESLIIFGSIFILKNNVDFKIKPTIWGKLTTFFQLFFIFWLFVCLFFKWVPVKTYYIIVILLAMFSLITLLQYIKIGLNYCFKRK